MDLNNLEVLSRAAESASLDVEISRLPAKKLFNKNWQQNAAPPSARPGFGSQSTSTPLNLPHSTSSPRSNDEKMDTSDDEHDEDSPLDMRIPTKQQDSDDSGVRPSVIRRAPSFKETSNSPFENQTASDPTSTCDPFIDEHFRRSLGNDYDLIINKNKVSMEQEIQKQRLLEEQKRITAEQTLQDQHLLKLKHHNYKKHQIHQHQAYMAAAAVKASMTPPVKVATPPSTPPIQSEPPQKQVIITENHEDDSNELSVDDHFAKALGENWQKKFNKEG